VLKGGERLPMLVERATGMPLFLPTVYSISQLRARNLATNTIVQSLRAVMLLYVFAQKHGIDVKERFRTGAFLRLNEIDALAQEVRQPFATIAPNAETPTAPAKSKLRTSVSMEIHRKRLKPPTIQEIDPQSAGNRLRYIRDYLGWLALQRLGRGDCDGDVRAAFAVARQQMLDAISARIPGNMGKSAVNAREGLAPEVLELMLKVIDPASELNPWKSRHARHRNRLLILWELLLGVRRGELLGVKIEDINFRTCEALIRRRADDEEDPRRHQPNAKTKDRLLPLTTELGNLTSDYILGTGDKLPGSRMNIKGARRHPFLFVADRTGKPMSDSALGKLHRVLRRKVPGLPDDLTGHVLRHSWNDRFSEEMDKRNVSEEKEKKMRSYLMGWSETSGTAGTYTRRHTRKRGNEVSLEIQQKMLTKRKGDA
jgi:integrase